MSDEEEHCNFFFLFIFRATESTASVAFTIWLKRKRKSCSRKVFNFIRSSVE